MDGILRDGQVQDMSGQQNYFFCGTGLGFSGQRNRQKTGQPNPGLKVLKWQ